MSALSDAVRAALADDPRIVFALGFGSRWRGGARPGSDLDLGVYVSEEPGFDLLADWILRVEAATGLEPVDLVVLNRADALLRFEALGGELLWSNAPETYAAFFSLTCREYEDEMARLRRFRALASTTARS